MVCFFVVETSVDDVVTLAKVRFELLGLVKDVVFQSLKTWVSLLHVAFFLKGGDTKLFTLEE